MHGFKGRFGAALMLLAISASTATAAHRHAAHSQSTAAPAKFALSDKMAIADKLALSDKPSEADKLALAEEAAPVRAAPVGAVTRVPYGWADFCTRRPEECRVDVLQPVDVVVNADVWQTLARVNGDVNAEIEPVSNLEHWGTLLDHWDYPVDGKGDCKIYALWKRKQLLDAGFPRQALLMTIVRDLEGNGHTVLTVKTDKGDFILDNMVGEIRFWDDTGYKFVKRQSQEDPNVWVSVGPATMPVTTAGLN